MADVLTVVLPSLTTLAGVLIGYLSALGTAKHASTEAQRLRELDIAAAREERAEERAAAAELRDQDRKATALTARRRALQEFLEANARLERMAGERATMTETDVTAGHVEDARGDYEQARARLLLEGDVFADEDLDALDQATDTLVTVALHIPGGDAGDRLKEEVRAARHKLARGAAT